MTAQCGNVRSKCSRAPSMELPSQPRPFRPRTELHQSGGSQQRGSFDRSRAYRPQIAPARPMPGPIQSRVPRAVPVARNSQPMSSEMIRALDVPQNVREGSQNNGVHPQEGYGTGRSPVSGRQAHHGLGPAQRRRPGPIDRLSALPARTAHERPEESCD
jgi:hypothetical protein